MFAKDKKDIMINLLHDACGQFPKITLSSQIDSFAMAVADMVMLAVVEAGKGQAPRCCPSSLDVYLQCFLVRILHLTLYSTSYSSSQS